MNPEFKLYEFSLDDWDMMSACEIKADEDWDKWCPGIESRKRLIGKGTGIIFKGYGFYATYYRSSNY